MTATETTAATMTGEERYQVAIRAAADGDQDQKVVAIGLIGADQALKDIACLCGIRRSLARIAEQPSTTDLAKRHHSVVKELRTVRAAIAEAQAKETALLAQADKDQNALGHMRGWVSSIIHTALINPMVSKALASEIQAAGIEVSSEALAEQDALVKRD